jgi:hypothetical protein
MGAFHLFPTKISKSSCAEIHGGDNMRLRRTSKEMKTERRLPSRPVASRDAGAPLTQEKLCVFAFFAPLRQKLSL